jgi:hypothetical protein
VAAGRFGLSVVGPAARRAEIEKVAQTILAGME